MKAPLKVGLIGCGHIASAHIKAWHMSGLGGVECVYDVNRTVAQQFASKFGVASAAPTLSDLLNRVDVVDDCSPPGAHLGNALKAFEAECHYLSEKPIVLTEEDLNRILRARLAAKRELCVVHNLKFSPAVLKAKRWVDQDRIGGLLTLESHFLTHSSTDRMLRAQNHWSAELPGGRWIETLPHDLYLGFDFLGPLELDRVTTVCPPIGWERPETPEEALIVFKGPESLAINRYSARSQVSLRSFVLYGTEGTVHVDTLAGSARATRRRDSPWIRGMGGDSLDALTTLKGMIPDRFSMLASRIRGESPHSMLIGQFARYLLGQGPSPVTLDEIVYVVRNTERIGKLLTTQARSRDRASVTG